MWTKRFFLNDALTVLFALIPGPAHGLKLIERVEQSARIKLSEGATYTILRRLERDGLLESKTEAGSSARGGRPKRVYTLTSDGQKVAREHLNAVASLSGAPLATNFA